jgi:hypothetical protein
MLAPGSGDGIVSAQTDALEGAMYSFRRISRQRYSHIRLGKPRTVGQFARKGAMPALKAVLIITHRVRTPLHCPSPTNVGSQSEIGKYR